jgi:protein gp37
MIFVNSMSDLFQKPVPEGFITEVWRVMAAAQHHTFQILTKRADRMAEVSRVLPVLPNVWLGVSVEDNDHAHRLHQLRETTAAVRFVSFEPLLGSVASADLTGIDWAIVGGESGPRARPMESEWVREIRAACRNSGTAFFFKQWGGRNKSRTGRTLDGRIWNEFPTTHYPVGAAQ